MIKCEILSPVMVDGKILSSGEVALSESDADALVRFGVVRKLVEDAEIEGIEGETDEIDGEPSQIESDISEVVEGSDSPLGEKKRKGAK